MPKNHDLHEPWHLEGDGYWVALVRADSHLVAPLVRRPEGLAILKWQQAYREARSVAANKGIADQAEETRPGD